MSKTVGLIFSCILIYNGNTQIDMNNICELGDSCLGLDPDCTINCGTDVTNVNDPSTLVCSQSIFVGLSDINTCCIPSIKGRPINGVIPPNCFNVTAPFDQSEQCCGTNTGCDTDLTCCILDQMGSQFVGSLGVAECIQNSDCCNKGSVCQSNQTLVDENPGSPFPIPAAICDCFPLDVNFSSAINATENECDPVITQCCIQNNTDVGDITGICTDLNILSTPQSRVFKCCVPPLGICQFNSQCCSGICTGETCGPDTLFPTSSPFMSPTTPKPTSASPTNSPTKAPTNSPTATLSPTLFPTTSPTKTPTNAPTKAPTDSPVATTSPTLFPTTSPTRAPTNTPTKTPTKVPSTIDSISATFFPTQIPTLTPTNSPTSRPTFDDVNDDTDDNDDNDDNDDENDEDDDDDDSDDDDSDDSVSDDDAQSIGFNILNSNAESITTNNNIININSESSILDKYKEFINNNWSYIFIAFILGILASLCIIFIIWSIYIKSRKYVNPKSFKYHRIIRSDTGSSVTVTEISDNNNT